jgi:HK97 family phage portal protein
MAVLYDMDTGPVEIAPGRGDLRTSSVPVIAGDWASTSVALAGSRRVSFARLFATQPMVAAAVMWLLAESVRVPLKVYRRTGDDSRERLRPGDHPLATAVAEPWERGSACQLTMAVLGSLSVHGNSVVEVDEGARGALRFVASDYRFAAPIMPWRDSISGWTLDSDDPTVKRTISVDNALHVAWWSPLGPLGVSPLQQLGVTLNIEDAAQRHQQSMLRNGARPPSAIKTALEWIGQDDEIKIALMEQLREDIQAIYGGPDNAGRPAILPPGLEWEAIGHTAVEAQLIEQRLVTRSEGGAVYRIQPGCFGFGSEKADTNLDAQRQSSYVDGLAPPLILIEQCINAQIVRGLMREDEVFCEFDFSGLLRPSLQEEVTAIRDQIKSALLTPNEGRAIRNMPTSDSPGMDSFYLERNNLWPLDQPYPDGQSSGSSLSPAGGSDA